jgi:hypothetical protein
LIKEDWIKITEGEIKVLLHYPKESAIFPADADTLTNLWMLIVIHILKDFSF